MLTVIGEVFDSVYGELREKIAGDAAVIQLERPPSYAKFTGLDDAVELAPSGQPVLMVAFSPSAQLAVERRFHMAMSYGSVRFERLPLSMEGLAGIVNAMSEGRMTRPDNHLVRRALSLPELQSDSLSTIKHDLGHAQNAAEGSERRAEMDARWMPLAIKLFGALDREALIAAVAAVESPASDYAPLAGESFDAVCCDVEGTLILDGFVLNVALLAELRALATDRPVVLWTGGDPKPIDQFLRRLNVELPLVPKQLLRGATVAMAYDDLSLEAFTARYGIAVDVYHQV